MKIAPVIKTSLEGSNVALRFDGCNYAAGELPDELRRFGKDSLAGRARAIPRGLFAFKGSPQLGADGEFANPEKFNYLVTQATMVVTNALPQAGQELKTTTPVHQRSLAACAGLRARETVTRRISQFARKVEYPGRRRPLEPKVMIARMRNAGEANRYNHAGLPVGDFIYKIVDHQTGNEAGEYLSQRRALKKCEAMQKHHPGSADRFEVVMREREEVVSYRPPRLRQLLESEQFSKWWDESYLQHEDSGWANGSFKPIPMWIWDPRLVDPGTGEPLTDTARLVLTYYVCKGLLDFGQCAPMQHEVAKACGISPSAVYLANQALARLCEGNLIRVVPRGGTRRETGEGFEPAKSTLILYLPKRTISHEDAEAERKRFTEALAASKKHVYDIAAATAHESLLRQYEGTEKHWDTFYKALSHDLIAAGLPTSMVGDLVFSRPPG